MNINAYQGGPLKIAMIGLRGIPATYGGIEHHVEEIGSRLVDRGHEVTVFSRESYTGEASTDTYRGMTVRAAPAPANKHLETLVNSAAATGLAIKDRFDVIHYHALGPGLFTPLPRYASRSAVVQTIHGLDDQRQKWGKLARRSLAAARWLSGRVPHEVIVVSRALKDFYSVAYGRDTNLVPNGCPEPNICELPPALADELGISAGNYIVYVGRLVPEKRADLLIEAYGRLDTDLPLLIVGGSSFTDDYVAKLEGLAAETPGVTLAGYRYGDELAALYANAGLFVLPSALEGLPLTLLEAIAYNNPVLVSAIAPHTEVVGESGPGHRMFTPDDADDLVKMLELSITELGQVEDERRAFRTSVMGRYNWDAIAEQTERVYRQAVATRRS